MSDSDGDDTRLFVAVAKTEVQSLTTDQPRQGNTASQPGPVPSASQLILARGSESG